MDARSHIPVGFAAARGLAGGVRRCPSTLDWRSAAALIASEKEGDAPRGGAAGGGGGGGGGGGAGAGGGGDKR